MIVRHEGIRMYPRMAIVGFLLLSAAVQAQPKDVATREQALQSLHKAVDFYHTKVASHGGYVYYYSLDLRDRWGEGVANGDTLFVQPPGTPTVGMAYLEAYAATKDERPRKAAHDAAKALVYGQLQSGGWTQTIHFARVNRMGKYRNGLGGNWNASSLDDDQTQAALRMLMRADQAFAFKDEAIHEACTYGLNALLKAQFANGGFPQIWTGPVPSKPVATAKFPTGDWKTEGRVKNYWDYYTLNDGLAGSVAVVLLEAAQIYKDKKYTEALAQLGNFLLRAQMPEPQPGWCQQYNDAMEPIWARKFEPPAITGWESQDAMFTLIKIAQHTGDKKYLEPIPKAVAYFEKNLLPDGRVARYYELKTNKPLYMDASYQLTYDDRAAPTHYGWKQPARFKEIMTAYEAARKDMAVKRERTMPQLEAKVRAIIADLDAEGRWVSTYTDERLVGQPKFAKGFRYLSSAVFSQNVETLSAYLVATQGSKP